MTNYGYVCVHLYIELYTSPRVSKFCIGSTGVPKINERHNITACFENCQQLLNKLLHIFSHIVWRNITSLLPFLPACLATCLPPICLFVHPSVHRYILSGTPSIRTSVYPYASPFFCVYHYICLSKLIFVRPSICVRLSVLLQECLSVCPSHYLSIYLFVHLSQLVSQPACLSFSLPLSLSRLPMCLLKPIHNLLLFH